MVIRNIMGGSYKRNPLNFIKIWLILIVFLVGSGCATKQYVGPRGKILPPTLGEAVKILEASEALYNVTLTTAGQLHVKGKLSDEDAFKIVKAANIYYMSHQAARSGVGIWYNSYYTEGADPEVEKLNVKNLFLDLADQTLVLSKEYEEISGTKLPIPVELTVNTIKTIFGGN